MKSWFWIIFCVQNLLKCTFFKWFIWGSEIHWHIHFFFFSVSTFNLNSFFSSELQKIFYLDPFNKILYLFDSFLKGTCLLNFFFFLLWVDKIEKLPHSVRVLLESAIRNCDNFAVLDSDVEKILDWEVN